MRALSIDQIEKAREETMKSHDDFVKSNAATFIRPDPMQAPGRWLGPRGVADHDLTPIEAQALVAERARVGHVLSFAERKTLLNRIRKIK